MSEGERVEPEVVVGEDEGVNADEKDCEAEVVDPDREGVPEVRYVPLVPFLQCL